MKKINVKKKKVGITKTIIGYNYYGLEVENLIELRKVMLEGLRNGHI